MAFSTNNINGSLDRQFEGDRQKCIHELFEAQVEREPDAIAVVFEDRQLTYRQLNAQANQLANYLKTLGVKAEVLVGICTERSLEMLVGILGVLKAGGAYVPLDPAYPQERLAFMVADAQVSVLLTQAHHVSSLPQHQAQVVCLDSDWQTINQHSSENPTNSANPENLAYVIYTSGSTGRPKGVLIEHRGLSNLAVAHQQLFHVQPNSRVLQFASFSFDASVSEIFMAFVTGATLVMANRDSLMPGLALMRLLREQRITTVTLPPTALALLPAEDLPDLQTIIVAGETCPPNLINYWVTGRSFFNAYGPTEVTVCATVAAIKDSAAPLSIGYPISRTQVYVLDSQMQQVSAGVTGELYIGGVGVARGYLNRPELTAEKFIQNPFSNNLAERLYKTGDLVRYLHDGSLEFLGRIDEQIKIRGYRVELGEIESVLAKHPAVQQTAIVVREDVPGDQRLIAYFVANQQDQSAATKPLELWPSIAEFYIYDELLYHVMTNDERRNNSYKVAINECVKDKVVLDIGTGRDAILARFCAEAGAKKVYAIELLEASFNQASNRIKELGLQEQIILINGDATQVELPEKVDVCVSEIVGAIGGAEGGAYILNNARRFLKPEGVMIPQRSTTKIAAVNLPEEFLSNPGFTEVSGYYAQKIFEQVGYQFDLRLGVKNVSYSSLISNVEIFEDLDFIQPLSSEYQRHIELEITKNSRINGFLVWLNLYTNTTELIDILEYDYCLIPVYLPVFHPGIAVDQGDRIEAVISGNLCENNLNIDYQVKGRLIKQDGQIINFDYTSFHYKQVFKHHKFYQELFADNEIKIKKSSAKAATVDWYEEHILQGQTLSDEVYSQIAVKPDSTFNIAGWNSSYTGLPIPEAEMREWVNQTVERILALQPKSVLEIGCGSGLLLFRIAPLCDRYFGTDFSAEIINYLQQELNQGKQALPQVEVQHRTADNFEGFVAQTFDTVIINSVSQHFPSIDYMLQVMEGAVNAVKPGGSVFVGDVRSLPLLEAYHTSVQLHQAPDSLSNEQLQQRVRSRLAQEEELVIDPAFFLALKQHLPQINDVEIQLKRGVHHNELTRFRYDVVLHIGDRVNYTVDFPGINWQLEQLTVPAIKQLLLDNQPEILALSSVTNARLITEIKALEGLASGKTKEIVGEFRVKKLQEVVIGLDPEEIWTLSNELPYDINISWSDDGATGSYDVILRHREAVRLPVNYYWQKTQNIKPWNYYANNPLRSKIERKLAPQLRQFLQKQLPDYMVPASFVMLDFLPLTPNGKIDRRSLPAPVLKPETAENFVPPRTLIEEILAQIWAEVLGLEQIGIYDNFLELGGHSLLAVQIISRVRQSYQIELPLRSLFESPTIASFAQHLETALQQDQEFSPPPIVPVPRNQNIPLSLLQEGIWFVEQLYPGSPFYNEPMTLYFNGTMNVAALEQSLKQIIKRHEIWRTTFSVVDGQPLQIIHPEWDFSLPVIHLEDLPETEREAEALRLAKLDAQQLFNLLQSPPWRAKLIKITEQDYRLCLTLHHIIFDGISIRNLFLEEIAIFYKAFAQNPLSSGREKLLPDLNIQYADFAVWQRQWLQGKVLETKVAYWVEQLNNLPILELPTDRPRPAIQTFRGARESFAVSPSLTKQIKALSRSEGVTLFMTMLTAFKILLSRYSGQTDIVVGTVSSAHNRPELEKVMGFFLNTLVLRTDLSGSLTFRQLLSRVRTVTLSAYAHQDLPFQKLLEELQPQRNLSHSPLFKVAFILDTPMAEADRDWRITHLDVHTETSKFDLFFEVDDQENEIFYHVEYNTDLFNADTIARMVGNYQTLLAGIVANPDEKITELPILTAGEQQKLQQWNKTELNYPGNVCLHQIFEMQVEQTPSAVAVTFEGEQLTYQQLNQKANQLAHYLQALGVKPDVMVGICVERSLEMAVGILGILKAGGAYVPLDPAYPQERLAFMLADTQVPVLLTQQNLASKLPAHQAKVVCLDSDWEEIFQLNLENIGSGVTVDNLAYVIYTSGSTGKPKGICLEQRPLLNLLHWHYSCLLTGARTLQFASLSFDASFHEMFAAWGTGGKLFIIPENFRLDVIGLGRYISEHKIEKVILPVVLLQQLAESLGEGGIAALQPSMFSNLKEVTTTGEQLQITPAIAQLFKSLPHCAFHNHYGPSETHVVTAFSLSNNPDEWEYHPPIGRPIANTQIYICDHHFNQVPVGVPGEIYISGVSLARGYLNRPDLTAEKFIPNPFSQNEEARLYKTGDLARYLADGNIEYLGRIDHQVKIRGFRIELGEVETAIAQHSAVQETVVIAREDHPGYKQLVAYIVTQQQAPKILEIRSFLKHRLPEYMLPSHFVMLESLPLTPTGKVDRRALPAPAQNITEIAATFVPARTPIEEVLAGLWTEVLRLQQVGIYDNFFELGGHSLLGAQLISRIRSIFKIELPLRKVFEFPTIASLAATIESATQENTLQVLPILPVSREQILPASFPQQQMWLFAQQQPNLPSYNNSMLLWLPGSLNVAALEQALDTIIKRHEAWRTTFSIVDGLLVQIIQPTATLALPIINLEEFPQEQQKIEILRLAKLETFKIFDLTKDLLIRVTLIRLNAVNYCLILTLHHIIYDGVSLNNVFYPELEIIYKAYCEGKPSPLPELSIQYADFAVWQRQGLQQDLLKPHIEYWQKQLANLPVLELPTDRPRPAVDSYRGATQRVELSQTLTQKLKALAIKEGATLFMTLLAAFKTLLCRYSNQEDIPVGIVTAGPNRPELNGLVGLFINLLVLRTDLSGKPSFRQLLHRVREVTLEAHAHKDMPFEQLIDQLQIEHRRLGQNPLFQVMFLLDPPMPTLDSGWNIDYMDVENNTAMSDLTLELYEGSEGLSGLFEYSTDLFDAATIERMAGNYCTLLESIVANPDQNIFDLQIVTAAEQQQLQQWDNTEFDYPEDLCLHQLFEMQVSQTPDAIAVTFENEQLTYQQLNQKANQLAHYLQSLGVKPDVMVGICVERSLEMAVGILGILKAGGAYVPLDPNYPQERLAFMLADTQVSVLLTQQPLVSRLPEHQAKVVCLDNDWQEIAQFNQENISSGVTVDNLAYVIYTSGSTGRPKGICLEQRPLLNLLHWHYSSLLTGARTLQFASLSFDASFHEMFAAWGTGGKLFIIPENLRLDVIGLGRYISEQEIEKVILPVVLLQQLAESLGERGIAALQPEMFSNLKEVTTTGEQLQITPAIACLFKSLPHCAFHNHYGPSETHVVTALSLTNHPDHWEYHPPIGVPIANTQIYIVDQHFNLVPVGVPGELLIGGVSLARGYLNRPDLTAEKFIPNPFSENSPFSSLLPPLPSKARLYKTGDLARYLPDGNIEYLGRIDHQVKIRGFRIELDEIEALLVQHPDIQEAVAIAREDVPGDKRLVAYVVSSLIPNRVPIETECLIEFNQNIFKLTSEDISVGGLCLVGIPTNLALGANVRLHLRLPGTSQQQWLKAKIAWCKGQKAGVKFDLNLTEKALLEKSVNYLLEAQGLLKALHRTITQNLRQLLQQQLPSYMMPDRFVILNSLPLTPNGKIDRRALPVPPQNPQQFATGFVAPRTPVEEVVAGIWMKLLGQEVSIHDNFLEVGGNSILAMQVISRLRDIFKMELPLRSLFEFPTVAGMAQRIELMGHSSFQLDDAPVVKQDVDVQLTPLQKFIRPQLIPTSFSQQRLWFLEQLSPGSPRYNLPLILEYKGLLNITVLEQSCQEIIHRHEALRTNFTQVEGQPVQFIAPEIPLNMEVIDLRELSSNLRSIEAQNIVDLRVQQPFNLEQNPLLRVAVIHLTETEHILLITMHHIVSDGWSFGVFTRELIALYESFAQQKPSTLPELPIQYADYAIWQRQQLQGEVLERHLAYWKQQLSGELPVLQLPTDRPRPAVQTFAGAYQTLVINKTQTEAIKQLSRQENATLFMTLLTVFKILLYRYTGNEDILIGTPISGRHLSEIEGLIGFFVNTQVLRTNLSGSPSFRELLKRIREVTLEAYAHKDLPFEKLVETVQPERNLSQSPLVQVMFSLQNIPFPQLSSSWKFSELSVDTGTAKFDLSLQFHEIQGEIFGELEYNTDLFDATTIERIAGHFQTLMAAIVVNPEQSIADLPLLTAIEEQQLQAWNSTEIDYPINACIHQLFEAQVEKTPDAVAVIFEAQQLTYSELNTKANQLAYQLRSAKLSRSESLGVGAEVLVGVCVERSLEMAIALLAILKAGGAYIPLDPAYPKDRIAFMLEDAQASVLLTQASLVSSLPQHQAQVICLDTDWETIAQQSQTNLTNIATPDNLAYVIYTSGSTGKPKGVQICHTSVVNFLNSMRQQLGITQADIFLAVTSLSFDIAGLEIFLPLTVGAVVEIVSREITTNGQQLSDKITNSGATFMQATPATWQMLLLAAWQGTQQLTILCGGEALSQQLANELVKRCSCLWNLYGPTETTIWSTIYQVNEENIPILIGRPIANTEIYLLDSHQQPVPIGVLGELHIGGAGLSRGYLNRPELTSEKFISNPFKEAGEKNSYLQHTSDRLYKTGDLARYLPDGNIEYLGRIDHQVKVRGFRIELGEIETALLKHPDVREVVVIARRDSRGDKRLIAYLVSNLIPDRLPYQTVVSLEVDETIVELAAEDISIGGICLVGLPNNLQSGQTVRLRLLLPGKTEECWLIGNIAWQRGQKAGIQFTTNSTEQTQLHQSLDYLLETQGLLKVLQRTITQNLRNLLQQQLPNYMIPGNFVLLRSLPLTPNGKVDRKALPDPERLQPEGEAVDVAPKTEIEQIIATLWQQVLQVIIVGVNDNFFDLGGHSLLIVQVQSQLQEILNKNIPIVDLFKYPTINALAQHLSQQKDESAPLQQVSDATALESRAQKQKQALNRQKQRRR